MIVAVRGGHNQKVRGAKNYVDEVIEDRLYYKELVSFLKSEGHTVIDATPDSTDTKYQDLTYGVSIANKYNADLFISCHVNSSNGKGYGCEVLYCPGSTLGSKYATNISKSISELGFRNRGAKVDSRGLYELRHTKMPAVIIEPFFLDNKGDVDIYKRVGPKELARVIAEGVLTKDIKQEDEEMIADTVRVAACNQNPIAASMTSEIKILEKVVGLKEDGIAAEELVRKLPELNGAEQRGVVTVMQRILILKGFLSNGSDTGIIGPACKNAIKKFKESVGIPLNTPLVDKQTWMKILEY